MVLAIISDTHLPRGARAIPAASVDRMRSADAILHAGDFMEASVLAELEALGPPVHAVRGNVDSPELQARLPLTRLV
ncbi:MAG: metallophosphoesterase family protein, partial [Actinomycetota bacterium]|nr:metallophosphoesterase family protein [Actinomycetota bacterium]